MGEAAPVWLIAATLAVYMGFLIGYGTEVFDPSEDGILDLISNVGEVITLGGIDSPLPVLIQVPLVLLLGIGWATQIGIIGAAIIALAGAILSLIEAIPGV